MGEAESAGSWSLSGQNLPATFSAASSTRPQWTDFPRGAISHQVQASLGLTSQAGVVMALHPGCVTVPSTQWVFLKTCSAHRS